ncbi:hypothetical protein D3C83_77270 [compost metagenome]
MSTTHAVGASLPVTFAALPIRLPNSAASQRTLVFCGPVMLSALAGVVQCASSRSACSLASPCQMTLTWPMVTSSVRPACTLEATSKSTP